MKTKFFLIAGIALCLLCSACGDDGDNGIKTGIATDDPFIEPDSTSKDSSKEADSTTKYSYEEPEITSSYVEPKITSSAAASILDEDYSSPMGEIEFSYAYDMAPSMDGGAGYAGMATDAMDGAIGIDVGATSKGESGSKSEIGSNNRKSGLLTASEWNDLNNWGYWINLLNNNNFYDKPDYWKFFPKNLVAVKVIDADSNTLSNVTVELLKGESVEFATKTDNTGKAYCWINLFNGESNDFNEEDFSLKINGELSEEPFKFSSKDDEELNINVIVNKDAKDAAPVADIAFIVDATGSMGDEISFLKSDLDYIISHATTANNVALRTAALFYRDQDDVYLTRHDDFSNDVATTQSFISQQNANGGGDYPEAVHTALEEALQKLSWNEEARARIAFLILDAPAHHTESIIESLQKSITLFAKNGIKIIPVAASGVDKDTEFMLRFFDMATGGTYVFLTNDSGIGGNHIEASVGEHEIELLADLMVRLIKAYVK